MKAKILKKLSYYISILFLIFLSFLIVFVVTISIKPLKINFLNYFDRESKIIQSANLKEIGDLYLSFNKVSKNFEIMIEDLVVDESYIPVTVISFNLDFISPEKLFQLSLKIFDGDLTTKISFLSDDTKKKNLYGKFLKKLEFLKKFDEIEIINNKLKIITDSERYLHFFVDLKYTHETISGLFKHNDESDNFFTFYFSKNELLNLNLEFKNFEIDFLKLFVEDQNFDFSNAYITGNSEIIISENTSIKKLFFNLFLTGNLKYETYYGMHDFKLEKIKVDGKLKDEILQVFAKFPHNESIFSIGTSINLFQKVQPSIFFGIDSITVDSLLDIWPKNLKESVFTWMDKNASGLITNCEFNLKFVFFEDNISVDQLTGNFDLSDVEIQYMDSMPSVVMLEGRGFLTNKKVTFDIDSGFSNNLKLVNGTVDLFDLDTDIEKANIDLRITSENNFIIDYLDLSPINRESFSKLRKISGEVDLNLYLDFPLFVDLKAEEINYSSDVKIFEANMPKIYKNFSVESLILDLKIDPEIVTYVGTGLTNGSEVSFKGNQSFVNGYVSDNINGKINLRGEFLNSLLNKKRSNFNGLIPIDFSYITEDDSKFKIEGFGDLSSFYADSAFLGDNLDLKNGRLRFIFRPFNKNYSGFIDVTAPDLNAELNFLFNDKEIVSVDVPKFKTTIQNFTMDVKKNEIYKVILSGEELSLNDIDFNNDNDFFADQDIDLLLDFRKLTLDKISFENSKIAFKKKGGEFDSLEIKLKDKKNFHKILIEPTLHERIFSLESNNASQLFQLVDLDLNLKSGRLDVNGKRNLGAKEYIGTIKGDDFVLMNAPFLTNFFTLFSLKGLAQKLGDGGILFESFSGDYNFEDEILVMSNSLIKGSELGIHFNGKMDFNSKEFDADGTIIPAYTINTLLTKFPIVGDIITAGSPEEGLIGANFNIKKIEGKYEISYNPISVFVPNIIKNFLGN